MKYLMILTIGVCLLIGTVPAMAEQAKDESNEKEQLCAIFVSESGSDDESSVKVTNEIEKKIKEKTKWFRLAEDPLEADIRIEVTQYGRVDQLEEGDKRLEGTKAAAGGEESKRRPMPRPGLPEVDRNFNYFIEFLLVVPRQFEMKMTTGGSSQSSAAKEVARSLRTMCETYCK